MNLEEFKNDMIKYIVAVNDANIAIIDYAVSRSEEDLYDIKDMLELIQPLENSLFERLGIDINVTLEDLREMII